MRYTKVDPFPGHKSRGTFDDIFDTKKYNTIEEAYEADDFVKCDYVRDENDVLLIMAKHVSRSDLPQFYELQIQNPFAGIDVIDDRLAFEMAVKLFNK